MFNKISSRISSKFAQYIRVWRLLKKPTYAEFKTISKVSAVGVIVIGAIGFAINVAIKLFFMSN